MIQNIDQDKPAEEYIAYMHKRHRDVVVRDAWHRRIRWIAHSTETSTSQLLVSGTHLLDLQQRIRF